MFAIYCFTTLKSVPNKENLKIITVNLSQQHQEDVPIQKAKDEIEKLRKKNKKLIQKLKQKESEISKLKSFNFQLQERSLSNNASEILVI